MEEIYFTTLINYVHFQLNIFKCFML